MGASTYSTVPRADIFRDKFVRNKFEHRLFLTMAPKG
jgi:hypothetical protein